MRNFKGKKTHIQCEKKPLRRFFNHMEKSFCRHHKLTISLKIIRRPSLGIIRQNICLKKECRQKNKNYDINYDLTTTSEISKEKKHANSVRKAFEEIFY